MVPVVQRMIGAKQLRDSGLFSHTFVAMDSIRNKVSRVIHIGQWAFFTIDRKQIVYKSKYLILAAH